MKILVENNYAKVWEDNGGLRHKINLVGANLRRGINTNEVIISSNSSEYSILCSDCEINGKKVSGQKAVMLELSELLVVEGIKHTILQPTYNDKKDLIQLLKSITLISLGACFLLILILILFLSSQL